jgi:hypothetical protein
MSEPMICPECREQMYVSKSGLVTHRHAVSFRHHPLCEYAGPYDDYTYGDPCICDRLRQAEQRGRRKEWVNQDDDMQSAHDDGYEQGQRDALAGAADRLRSLLFRKDGRLHSVGSSVDAGGGIEFCCACDSNYQAAVEVIAAITGGAE